MADPIDEFVAKASQMTDDHFKSQFSSLTSLNDVEVEKIVNDTGISNQDLASVLQAVKDASAGNEAKANAIKKIDNGVSTLVAIAHKFL